jgi:hypothetical protein
MMNSFVIESAIDTAEASVEGEIGNITVYPKESAFVATEPVVRQPTSANTSMPNSNGVFGPSSGTGTPYRAISPQIPCSPPTQARSPFVKYG